MKIKPSRPSALWLLAIATLLLSLCGLTNCAVLDQAKDGATIVVTPEVIKAEWTNSEGILFRAERNRETKLTRVEYWHDGLWIAWDSKTGVMLGVDAPSFASG